MWTEAEKFLHKDKYIGPLLKKWGNCKIKKSPKERYFIDLLEAIANQQLSGKAAATIFGRVRDLCKGKITPDVILKLSEAKLRRAGLSFAKIKYAKDLATRVMNNELIIKDLDKLEDEKVVEELVKVKGIGRWTAEMFLMFSLGRPDIFPVDDLGIKKGFEKVTGKKFDKDKSAKFALKYWSPYRTVASWYLWRSLEN
jgi:3-methyladenine DNA glycosylase/8-oxoguanine DNA glycosylase